MRQVTRVAGGLGADVAELERHAGRNAGLVESAAQGQQAQRLAVVILDQVGTLPNSGPSLDALHHFGQLSDDLNGSLCPGLVLRHEQCAIPNVGAHDLQHVGRPLAGQECEVHRVAHGRVCLVAHGLEFFIGDVPISASLGETFYTLAGVRRVGVAPFAGLVEQVAQQGLLTVGAGLTVCPRASK